MMRLVSDTTYSAIKAYSDANGNLFGSDIYPIIGSQKARYPFAVYQVDKTGPLTKDGIHDVEVTITIVDDKYERLCDSSDGLENHFESIPEFIYMNTEGGFNPEKYEEHYMSIVFRCQMTK